MIPHPPVYTELLADAEVSRVVEAALRVLAEVGMEIHSEEGLDRLADHGVRVEHASRRARFSPDFVMNRLEKAPRAWTLQARNPDRSVEIGRDALVLGPGYGSAFVGDARGERRPATLDDLRTFLRLGAACDVVDLAGGLVVEPCDVEPSLRPAEVTYALLTESDKPIMGSVDGARGADIALDMAEIVFGSLDGRLAVLGLININSPLRLEARMADAMIAYLRRGQPLLFTPGILMGVTAPVTPLGALVQATAELMACVVLTQVFRPGAAVMVGLGGFGADLRSAGTGFGRPEQVMATYLGAQVARRLGLPYRCSPMTTGAFLSDCRAGCERMMTAMAAWHAGAHLGLQSFGILDSINTMSLEQFVLDAEYWGYLRHVASGLNADAEALAVEEILALPGDYMSTDHTIRHFRKTLHLPSLVPAQSYDAWVRQGKRDVASLAAERAAALAATTAATPLPPDVCRDLEAYLLAARRSGNGGLTRGRTSG